MRGSGMPRRGRPVPVARSTSSDDSRDARVQKGTEDRWLQVSAVIGSFVLIYQAREKRLPALPVTSRSDPLTPASCSSLRPNSQSRSDRRLTYARIAG